MGIDFHILLVPGFPLFAAAGAGKPLGLKKRKRLLDGGA
jgi:hypothetical protein